MLASTIRACEVFIGTARHVPDAVLAGGRAAAWHARHRASVGHHPGLADLCDRFDVVPDGSEEPGGRVPQRVTAGRTVLGELGHREAGVRQVIRTRPLEVREVTFSSACTLRIATREEIPRVEAFLIARRNEIRDCLDVAALADRLGTDRAAVVLAGSDADDVDQLGAGGVARQAARLRAEPRPMGMRTTRALSRYERLEPRWYDGRMVTPPASEP